MKEFYFSYNNSPLGLLLFKADNYFLLEIDFVEERKFIETPNNITLEAVKQVDEYFQKKRKYFTLPIKLSGTDFEVSCYRALLKIPYGETVSYQDIATTINNPKAVRAVGRANGKNKLPIVVPCHRVINKDKKLGGYSGGISNKVKLLELEAYNLSYN